MTYSYNSRRELVAKQQSIGRDMSFELWKYDHDGHQLDEGFHLAAHVGQAGLYGVGVGEIEICADSLLVRRVGGGYGGLHLGPQANNDRSHGGLDGAKLFQGAQRQVSDEAGEEGGHRRLCFRRGGRRTANAP